MAPKRRTSFFLDDSLSAGLKALKSRDGVPEAEAIRRAIAEYLKRRGVKVVQEAGKRGARTQRKANPHGAR